MGGTHIRAAGAARAKPAPKCAGTAMVDPRGVAHGSRKNRTLLGVGLTLVTVAAATSCLSRRDGDTPRKANECAACHGDPRRRGNALLQAAPPRDLSGATDVHYPGVGAHLIHLQASATHAAVACDECHRVPERVDSPGHAEDGAPAEIIFGALAKAQDHHPGYDSVARRCENSYCHGAAVAVWTRPRSSDEACGSCHGLPPSAPHPQSRLCHTCHGEIIDSAGKFVNPALHVNGEVNLAATSCTQCHGSGDEPAPPRDTLGHESTRALGVGAHAAHLNGGSASRPLACTECHDVPASPDAFEHADGLPAEVRLLGVAQSGSRSPEWHHETATCTNSWCHAPGDSMASDSLRWDRPAQLGCTSCHGAPPPAPHPQMTDCARCHGDVVAPDNVSMRDRSRHVDGIVDVHLEQSCTACHGSNNAAPPTNVDGAAAVSARGVGAHQTHVVGTSRSRAVPCRECHRVPEEILSPGHTDTPPPAEVVLSGAASAFGPGAAYQSGSCANTSCHGAVFPDGNASGGTLTLPNWYTVDGTQAGCGTCHALPPPRPHPYHAEDCGRCHENMSPDGKTFLHPELHVDGIVTFQLP